MLQDSHTERQIQEALERVTAGRTTVTIAYVSNLNPIKKYEATLTHKYCRHRLSTIVDSDQIIVLHNGKVVERGTHDELLELKGSYHAMWEKQTTTDKKKSEKDEVSSEE